MMDELIELFCEHGGIFENMTIGYRQVSGYYCSVIDSHRNATVFCPTHLLVDVDDIGISETGLFITKPENYANNILLLEKYLTLHFGERMVGKYLEEKQKFDSLTGHEKLSLKRIGIPHDMEGVNEKLEYVKRRIFQSHQLTLEPLGKIVIVPFVTFLNHDQSGVPFWVKEDGVSVSGKFEGEVFANYHAGDVLAILMGHRFVTVTEFIYSLPMWIKLPDDRTLQINRDTSKFKIINGRFRWPVAEEKNRVITVSWLPMYSKYGPLYPARVAESLVREFNIPAEIVIYQIFRFNLNALLSIAFDLKDSKNGYVQMLVSGVEKQLELIGGIQK